MARRTERAPVSAAPYDIDDGVEYEAFPKERKGGCGSKLLAVFVVLFVLGLIAGGLVFIGYQRQVNPSGAQGAAVKVTIPLGSSTQGIGTILAREGVITSARVFRVYSKVNGLGGFQAGEYTFHRHSSMGAAVSVLRQGPQLKFERITVPEGLTLPQIADRIGRLAGRSKATFLSAAGAGQVRSHYQPATVTSLEGLLLPETYNVEPKDDEAAILRRMASAFDSMAQGLGYDNAQARVALTPYQAIIVASLVERETRIDDERAKVAQVIYNRIRNKMPLQIDATVVYALGRTGVDTKVSLDDLKIDSPYNTYKISGLPPTPIAAPGAASLRAALNPEAGPWLYYVVTEKDGRHSFGATLSEQNANIRKAQTNGVR
jgi:UPF0755 protein